MSNEPLLHRRAFLRSAALLTSLAADLARAQDKARNDDVLGSAPGASLPTTPNYQPTFFSLAEWRFVMAACDRLIPRDETGPGAVEVGVPEYIDRALQRDDGGAVRWYMQGPFVAAAPQFGYQLSLTPRQQYRLGVHAIDAGCMREQGCVFADLPTVDQDEKLKSMEAGSLRDSEIDLKVFFSEFLLKHCLEGYFGDPMYGGNKNMAAWKMIGYPGVRGDFADFVKLDGPYPFGPVSLHGREA